MGYAISAAEANRQFSRLLREVRGGRAVVVTSHGRPVAKIVPITADASNRSRLRTALLARLRSERLTRIGRWTREDLYE